MWSDSDTYMHWGRDVFGWPVIRAPVELEGEIGPARSGRPRRAPPPSSSPTEAVRHLGRPRRGRPPAADARGVDHAASHLLAARKSAASFSLCARPSQYRPPREVTGDLDLSFREPHPLADLQPTNIRIELSAGIELRVGDVVELL